MFYWWIRLLTSILLCKRNRLNICFVDFCHHRLVTTTVYIPMHIAVPYSAEFDRWIFDGYWLFKYLMENIVTNGHYLSPYTCKSCIAFKQSDGLNFDSLAGKCQKHQNVVLYSSYFVGNWNENRLWLLNHPFLHCRD